MAFTVHQAKSTAEFDDNSTYQYLDHGLLKVSIKDDAGEVTSYRTFSPSGWLEVTSDADHPPGRPKGRGGSGRKVTVLG